MQTALLLPCFNRSSELQACLDSLLQSDIHSFDYIVIHDDNSTDLAVVDCISRFIFSISIPVISYKSKRNMGIKRALIYMYEMAFENIGVDICCNLDSDAIVKSNFATTVLGLKARFPDRIISGFNCNHHKNPILREGDGYVERRHCNGINMIVNREQYLEILYPALTSNSNWDFQSTHNKNFIISCPSVVDHLGWDNSTMGHVNGDRACDF